MTTLPAFDLHRPATLEAATDYATREGIAYDLRRGSERRLKLQAYADNFR